MRTITYDGTGTILSDVTTPDEPAVVDADARMQKITGAKKRARKIGAFAQAADARTATAWTQPQRVAILDAIGDLALMVSWLTDDRINAAEPPD